ncbi:DUF541 domain-containing protein [Candidatus Saccharibacteria bacterium CPR2]|nr:DUF541 domain-containing protein [Candidatus Saccharibacteria bacterium CPR2]
MDAENEQQTKNKNKLNFSIDCRILTVLLIVSIGIMLAIWQPWKNSTNDTPKNSITINGSSVVEAEPDEFIFNLYYETSGDTQQAATEALNKKVNEVTDKVKELGIDEKDITTDTSSSLYLSPEDDSSKTVSTSLTIKARSKEIAQKVQDYVQTTDAVGSVSPYANFSKTKRDELENSARDKAIEDAKQKAEKTANSLGRKLGKVVSFTDMKDGLVLPMPYEDSNNGTPSAPLDDSVSNESTKIYPGQQDVDYSVEVVFELN